jgi:hypothetical protein
VDPEDKPPASSTTSAIAVATTCRRTYTATATAARNAPNANRFEPRIACFGECEVSLCGVHASVILDELAGRFEGFPISKPVRSDELRVIGSVEVGSRGDQSNAGRVRGCCLHNTLGTFVANNRTGIDLRSIEGLQLKMTIAI